ncbi:GumC family protein [Alteromonas oceanisediminis]|uniref:GumC family protein n=1 Tax=Alteromonas oceanisediminis TaxID=2836180 RepID=UPI001BDA3EEA|nr:polysaccharide biosynthesis tyrosine autokinase [Alteromonas oceanisediminis]MBT0587787.1 polysaccharide biosynthesis tyrosine autokinase [Alteromonas oceanisediminis]
MEKMAQPSTALSFDLSDLLIFLWQKKVRIIVLAGLMTLVGAYYVVNLPRIYSAESTLMLSQRDNQLTFPIVANNYQSNSAKKMETHIQFMKSRQFAIQLIQHLGISEHPEFRSANSRTLPTLEAVARKILGNLNISKVSDTDMIKVSYEAKSPKLAADVANAVGPVFFAHLDAMSRKRAIDNTRWLNEELDELQIKLSESEENLLTFQRENDLIDVNSQIDLAKTEISKILEQKLVVDKNLSAARSITQQIASRENRIEQMLQIPEVAINDTVRDHRNRVLAQEQVLEEVSKRYKYKHYKYKAAESSLNLLRQELEAVLLQIVNGKQQAYDSLIQQEKQLQDQLDVARARLNNLGKYELQLARMEREVEATRRVYELFLAKMQETQILQDIGETEEFAIIDYAIEPQYPTKPRITLGIALSLIFSTIFSAGFWLLIHLIRDRRNRFRQLLAGLGLPLLAEVPKVDWKEDKLSLKRPATNVFGYDEAIRSVRTKLVVNDSAEPLRKIVVVSMTESDGRDEVAIALAESFSSLEKTLLIDCDLRTQEMATRFKLRDNHPGIVDFINRSVKFNKCLHRRKNSQMVFIPSGLSDRDPVEHISKPRFASLIHKLSVFYERLIITAPSVTQYSDSLVLAQHVDGIVIVCDIEKTDSGDFVEGVRRLQDSGVTILGVVFNRVKGIKTARPESILRKRFFKQGSRSQPAKA